MPNKKVKLSRVARKLLNLVPPDGTFIEIRNFSAGQNSEKTGYWKFQRELVWKGALTRGKGRGG